ncbi:MAG: type II toxin-antitoxin system VapC family toxin [Chitinophagales bacterium]
MKILLDTHAIIWSTIAPEKLSAHANENIADAENEIFVSAVSIWEISIKYGLGKFKLGGGTPVDILSECKKLEFKLIPLQAIEAATYFQLPLKFHKDPFDRMLVWQAIQNRYHLMSKDKNLSEYRQHGLLVSW